MSRPKSLARMAGVSPGIKHMEEAFDLLERHEYVGSHRAYEALLDFLGHGITNTIIPAGKYPKELQQSVEAHLCEWAKAWLQHNAMEDDIGTIMEHRAFATFDRAGQFLTPMSVSRTMAVMQLGEPPAGREASDPIRVIDPAVGTGRMLLAVAEHTAEWNAPIVASGVDVDLRMVRVTIVNLFMANMWRDYHDCPYGILPRILHADALAVELELAQTWRHASQWTQPHWDTLPVLGSGRQAPAAGLQKWIPPDERETAPIKSVEDSRRARSPKSTKPKARGTAPIPAEKGRQLKLGEA